MAAKLGGDRFETAAQLVDLNGETGQGSGAAATGVVLVNDGEQVGLPVRVVRLTRERTADQRKVTGCPAAASSAQAASRPVSS